MKNVFLPVSSRAQATIASPIRKYLPLLLEAERRGIKFYKLNTGDPDIAVPPVFWQALKKYPSKNLHYAPSPGEKVQVGGWQKYYANFGVKLEANEILVTSGCAEAILFALLAAASPAEEVIVFEPLYVSYKSFAAMAGIRLVPVRLRAENGFTVDLRDLEKKITKKTRAVVIVNPDNPTGKLWSHAELTGILEISGRKNLFVIADETYREIRFEGQPESMLSLPGSENVIVADSASKRFSMPGARLGCLVSRNTHVMEACLKFAQARLSVGSLEQYAAAPLLKNSLTITRKTTQEYKNRRDALCAELSKIPEIVFNIPKGAFYLTVKVPGLDADAFTRFLLSKFSVAGRSVLITPLADFYVTPGQGRDEFRIAYVLPGAELKKAAVLLGAALQKFKFG